MAFVNQASQSILSQRVVDFTIHGIVGVRLVDPAPNDLATLVPLLGSPQATVQTEPEIVITFKEKWAVPKLRYLGLNAMAFNDDGFYVLNWKNGAVRGAYPF